MPLLLLVLLWLLTFVLGRISQVQTWRFSHWIPGMVFFRVSLTAAVLSRLLQIFGQQGDVLSWLRLVELAAFYVALVELLLDLVWVALARLSRRGVAPPRILKDLSLVAAAMLVVAAQLKTQGLLTTLGSAAVLGGLAFVVGPGSASQISNISSALTVQVERQFSVGDWVDIDGMVGRVDNVSWNSTYLYDDILDRLVVLPNSLIDTGKIINLSRPTSRRYRLEVEIGLPYDMPPGEALALLHSVLDGHPEVIESSQNQVVIGAFADSSITYLLRFFVRDFGSRGRMTTEVFSSAWYAVERAGYSIPFPVVDLRTHRSSTRVQSDRESSLQERSFRVLRSVALFAALSDAELREIVGIDPVISFGHTETIVTQGDIGGSMYVLLDGVCSAQVDASTDQNERVEIAQLTFGEVFGEVAALTNTPRTASVQAIGHVVLQEISQRSINTLFRNNAEAMEAFAAVMATREAAHRQFDPDQTQTYELALVDRMRQTFARLFAGD
ncbi:MAG: cyclic nucleotide-binding domain-containing protein [Synechococcus sp.]